jgi:hypothetical protein
MGRLVQPALPGVGVVNAMDHFALLLTISWESGTEGAAHDGE